MSRTLVGLCARALLCIAPATAVFIPLHHPLEQSLQIRAFSDFKTDGKCTSGQEAKLTTWVTDAIALADAAIDAITSLQAASRPYSGADDWTAKTLHRFLGVDYATGTASDYTTISGYYTAAKNFMSGQYAPYNVDQSWIFCGDYFTEPKQWTDIAYDRNGNEIPTSPTDNTPLKLEDVPEYTAEKANGNVPYWIDAMKRYAFQLPNALNPGQRGRTPGGICTNGNKNPLAVHIRTSDKISVITICDPMNKPVNGKNGFTLFPYDKISDVPIAAGKNLNYYRTGSGTMLHEIIHASRPAGRTPDTIANNFQQCATQSNRAAVRHSPECAAVFASAMWIQTKTKNDGNPYVFWSGAAAKP
ncbi:hypothetical protein F5B22DRAFT_662413 [Xylaria bambusicola]|uniref:uncharacterized protein n=1 Tax=Xylaria bambusicola TaxID=326684 RepID=UPI0020086794|nr:uncharacterized protein F5B22DRAFT_662413 [Xylaria bambusicola]KAI0521282.1 hypothetical protein F5B22DRAFT_662413 [Xylaria bambusicola]